MLRHIRRLFHILFSRNVGVDSSLSNEEKRSNVIKRVFFECPVCNKSLNDHAHWKLASAILGPLGNNADYLAEYVAEKQWEEAAKVNEWEYRINRDTPQILNK